MMRLSTKSRYGSRAMLDLALHHEESPVTIRDIASRLRLTERYLENIMAMLATRGLVRSTRGKLGGFKLAKPPQEINMVEIVQVTEGSLSLVPCVEDNGECENTDSCVTFDVWKRLKESIEEVLGSFTLQDLVDRYRLKESEQIIEYFI